MEGQLIQAQRRQKGYYYRNSNLSDSMRLKVGYDVCVLIPHVGVAKKFENRWEGNGSQRLSRCVDPEEGWWNQDGYSTSTSYSTTIIHTHSLGYRGVWMCHQLTISELKKSKINELLVEDSKLSTNTSRVSSRRMRRASRRVILKGNFSRLQIEYFRRELKINLGAEIFFLDENLDTSTLLDTSPNVSINDSILRDVQWSLPSDHNSSISS